MTVLVLVALVVGGVLLAINFTGGKTYEEEVIKDMTKHLTMFIVDTID